ncbi:Cold-shock DEAD-box protein A [hydrothermal vent metagenome]|uniref:Cold-shock DEAD-box protein A n=1 Tax=hydrothermal vent metagenome TaxID=652676 RepID=A0A1W1EK68_9ZZZZ
MKFQDMNLPQDMVDNLNSLGYIDAKDIQIETIPYALEGDDIVAKAKTGSGKTLAFLIPSMLKIDVNNKDIQILILAPTRELVSQIATETRKVARYIPNLKVTTIVGGESLTAQVTSLSKGSHIVVSTVGRIIDHLSRETIDLSKLRVVILDEADRMLDMGFRDEVEKIIRNSSRVRQTLLFSATINEKIDTLISKISTNPERINLNDTTKNQLEEIAYISKDKEQTLLEILSQREPKSTIIFCNTKIEVDRLNKLLRDRRFSCDAFHGDFTQPQRDEIFLRFANHTMPILIATDIASRGLDVEKVELIINYDIPDKRETYIHRVGRSARVDSRGVAVTIYKSNEKFKLDDIVGKVKLKRLEENIRIKPIKATMNTVVINGGKRDKIRKGDLLGVLCKDLEISPDDIGKIIINERKSFIAISARVDIKRERIKIKKRNFKFWYL